MKKQKGRGLADDVYDGSAAFGKFMGLVTLITGLIIGIGLIIGGIFLLLKKETYNTSTTAVVKTVSCSNNPSTDSKNNTTYTYSCHLTVEYTTNKNEKMTSDTTTNRTYSVGENITIYYNDTNPKVIASKLTAWKLIGGVLLGFGIVILASSILHYYVVNRFKFAAAANGVGQGIAMIK
jgi:hypothetical protein